MQLRRATLADLDLLVRIDREDEGVTRGDHTWGEREIEVHRQLIRSFVIEEGARIAEVEGNAVTRAPSRGSGLGARVTASTAAAAAAADPLLFRPDMSAVRTNHRGLPVCGSRAGRIRDAPRRME